MFHSYPIYNQQYWCHDRNGSRPVATSVPSCAKDCGALRAGDQRGERGEAPEGRRVGGAAHVLSAGAVGAVSRCCGVLWAVGLGKFCVGISSAKQGKTWGKWFINVYYILHIIIMYLIIMVILYIAYNYKGIS